jgi:hypothetical protein
MAAFVPKKFSLKLGDVHWLVLSAVNGGSWRLDLWGPGPNFLRPLGET